MRKGCNKKDIKTNMKAKNNLHKTQIHILSCRWRVFLFIIIIRNRIKCQNKPN